MVHGCASEFGKLCSHHPNEPIKRQSNTGAHQKCARVKGPLDSIWTQSHKINFSQDKSVLPPSPGFPLGFLLCSGPSVEKHLHGTMLPPLHFKGMFLFTHTVWLNFGPIRTQNLYPSQL